MPEMDAPRAFSSPEAALLLISIENHDLWPYLWPGPTPEVRDSRSSRHCAHALCLSADQKTRGLWERDWSDKPDWLWSQSIVFTKPFKTDVVGPGQLVGQEEVVIFCADQKERGHWGRKCSQSRLRAQSNLVPREPRAVPELSFSDRWSRGTKLCHVTH